MDHLSADRLAALAADPAVAPTPEQRDHLASCRACGDELDALHDLVGDLREAGSTPVRVPHPEVWAAVERELADDDAPASPVPAGLVRRRSKNGPSRYAVAGLAAAVGLLVGVGSTLGVLAAREPVPVAGPALVASTVLVPLPGQAGQGTAELVRTADSLQVRVHASLGSSPSGDYHEVWLINSDGRRMFALGVLPSSGDASYWLPPPLASRLDGYQTVDISLEPEDGDAAHSQHSLVRGRLPT